VAVATSPANRDNATAAATADLTAASQYAASGLTPPPFALIHRPIVNARRRARQAFADDSLPPAERTALTNSGSGRPGGEHGTLPVVRHPVRSSWRRTAEKLWLGHRAFPWSDGGRDTPPWCWYPVRSLVAADNGTL